MVLERLEGGKWGWCWRRVQPNASFQNLYSSVIEICRYVISEYVTCRYRTEYSVPK